MAQCVLDGLEEETAFVEFNVDCDTNILFCYDWLRAHDLAFLYDANQACLCAERGCVSGRRVRLDLTLDQPAPLASPLSAADLRALLGSAGLGPVPTLGRPSHWSPAMRRPALAATLTAAVEAAWAADTLAGLADAGTTLADGTELLVGRIAFAVEGPVFTLPPDGSDPQEFASLATEFGDVLGGPQGLHPAFLLTAAQTSSCASRLVLTSCPAHESRLMKRW